MSIQLDRIGWKDEPSTDTPIDSGNLGKMEDNTEKFAKNLYDGYNLYSNLEGTSDTINIDKNIFSYKELKITYRIDYSGQETTYTTETIPLIVSGEKVTLHNHYLGSIFFYTYETQLTITNNQITFYGNRAATVSSSGGFKIENVSPIKIIRIDAYDKISE